MRRVFWILVTNFVILPQCLQASNCTIIKTTTECTLIDFRGNHPLSVKNYTRTLKLHPLLKEIPPRTFVSVPEITTLIINHTMAEKVYDGSFQGLTNLKNLDLYFNQIDNIPTKLFQPCPHLIYLNFGANNLKSIDNEVFKNLEELEILVLSWNLLTNVPNFQYLRNLKSLDLSKNQIGKLRENSFTGLSQLEWLNLKGNQMKQIQGFSFKHLLKLNFLNIEWNELRDITVNDLVEYLPNLREIRIRANQFTCETLTRIISQFQKRNVYIPEGLAEDELINVHGIFCLPRKYIKGEEPEPDSKDVSF